RNLDHRCDRIHRSSWTCSYAQDHGCAYILVDRNGRKLADAHCNAVDDNLQHEILERLEAKPTLYSRDLKDLPGGIPRREALAAVAVQCDLSFQALPFLQVRRLSDGYTWRDLLRVSRRLYHGVGVRTDSLDSPMRMYWSVAQAHSRSAPSPQPQNARP
ncbi:MAG: hypothetical protein OXT09_12565, partial [Myxococcales bacterium]|nr:hypothetical protein [Myxococcales bacterium]